MNLRLLPFGNSDLDSKSYEADRDKNGFPYVTKYHIRIWYNVPMAGKRRKGWGKTKRKLLFKGRNSAHHRDQPVTSYSVENQPEWIARQEKERAKEIHAEYVSTLSAQAARDYFR